MKGVNYSKQKKRWGYDILRRGERYAVFHWEIEEDACVALRALLADLDKRPKLPKNPLIKVFNEYLAASCTKQRSDWRIDALANTFQSIIIPYFGATRDFNAITGDDVTEFVEAMRHRPITRRYRNKRGVVTEIVTDRLIKNSTIWHYIVDLRALYNWAMEKPPTKRLADRNPVNEADLSAIAKRKFIKPLFDPKKVDAAAQYLPLPDRVWYDFARFTGSRKDEANRVEWAEHLFLNDRMDAWYLVPGSKTEDSADYIPLPPELVDELLSWKAVCPAGPYVFPGRSSQTKGKKIYSRRRMFERIQKKSGIKLTPKDLRDYFANEVASKTDDPAVIMRLLRHKSLATTTKYIRTVQNRMRETVHKLVVNRGCETGVGTGQIIPQEVTPEESPTEQEPNATH